MLERLGERHRVGYLDAIGHDPAYPVSDCWPYLVSESIHFIERHYDGPVFGVGHSLGGFLMFYAALARPELFKGIIILDSPLFGPRRAFGVWLAKKLGFIDRVTPGGNTLKRRDNWASVEMVRDYFARKPMFARFDPDCLSDYALHGTEPTPDGGRRLKFRPTIEHAIYCALPHDFPRHRGRLTAPAMLLAGSGSDVLGESDLSYIRKHYAIGVEFQDGSHLFPLERPLATAEHILQLIDRHQRQGGRF